MIKKIIPLEESNRIDWGSIRAFDDKGTHSPGRLRREGWSDGAAPCTLRAVGLAEGACPSLWGLPMYTVP
jgi:hypothetical protein